MRHKRNCLFHYQQYKTFSNQLSVVVNNVSLLVVDIINFGDFKWKNVYTFLGHSGAKTLPSHKIVLCCIFLNIVNNTQRKLVDLIKIYTSYNVPILYNMKHFRWVNSREQHQLKSVCPSVRILLKNDLKVVHEIWCQVLLLEFVVKLQFWLKIRQIYNGYFTQRSRSFLWGGAKWLGGESIQNITGQQIPSLGISWSITTIKFGERTGQNFSPFLTFLDSL